MPAEAKPILIEGEVRAESRGLAVVIRGEGDTLVVETASIRAALRAMPKRGRPSVLVQRSVGPLDRAGLRVSVRRRGREVATLDPKRPANFAGRLLGVAPARVSIMNLLRP